jgi:hypothetical protein
MTWLQGKRTFILAGITTVLSVLAMTDGWVTTAQGVQGILMAALFAALRAGLGDLANRLPPAGGAK